MTSASEGKKGKEPDPRKVGQNPTGNERRSSAGRRRRAEKREQAQRRKG